MKKQRVDVELSKDTLKWAGVEAAKLGISRRKFLQNVITRIKFLQTEVTGHLEFIHSFPGGNRVLPFSFENPVVEYGNEDFMFSPSSTQRFKIWENKSE